MKDYRKEMEALERKDLAELKKKAPKFPVPEGFTTEWKENYEFSRSPAFIVQKADDVKFVFHPGGAGTTKFKVGDSWRTFDRTGVESSFYWKPWNYKGAEPVDLKATYKEHFERIAKSREFNKTAISIPEVGHRTSPAGLEKLKVDLKKVGYVSFHPSGFGTGYRVCRKAGRFTRRAKKELEDFFGVTPLFIETFDCD